MSKIFFYLFSFLYQKYSSCPVGWGCRVRWLLLCRGVWLPRNECPVYDTEQSDGKVLVMLELWGMLNTPSLPSFPGLLRLEVVAPDRVLCMGQREIDCILMSNGIFWNRTVYLYKKNLALNNLQRLISIKQKTNKQTNESIIYCIQLRLLVVIP